MTSDSSSDAQHQKAANGGPWRDGWRLVAWCVVCVVAPLMFLPGDDPLVADTQTADQPVGWQQRRRSGLDTMDKAETVAGLRSAQPDYIGIGNSMMYTRLGKTPDAISALTGRKFYLIWHGGSALPEWYLTVKNVVATSGVRPKAIFIFIRDDDLTRPFEDSESLYLKSLRSREEPEVDRFMRKTGPGAGAWAWLDELYAFPEWRDYVSRRVTDTAMDLGGGGTAKKSQRLMLATRFALEHLRGDVAADMAVADEDDLPDDGANDIARYQRLSRVSSLDEIIRSSLLPDLMRAVESCGTRLVVFRVKRRPNAVTHMPKEPQGTRAYSDSLRRWLTDRGAIYFDESYDTSIHVSDYLDGDHIHPDRIEWYRQYFWQRMQGLFP